MENNQSEILLPARISARQRSTFHRYIVRSHFGDCIIWIGAKTEKGEGRGYAIYDIERKATLLHRQLWQDHRYLLRPDQQLDHLCRNRACINLDHLEVVTLKENVLRGEGLTAENFKKTECEHGHKLEGDNLYDWTDKKGGHHRICRECVRIAKRAYRAREREAGRIPK